jgi:non-structural maintenance of chromosomes element 1
MVTRGVACYTRQCKTRMHNHCLKAFVKRNNTCPACQVSWDEAGRAKLRPVGEGAVKDGQDEHRRTREVDEDEEEEEEEEEAEVDYEAEEPSQSQPSQSQPSRSSQRKGKARQVVVDDDDDDDDAMEEDVKPSQTQGRRKSQRG